ncbi:19426_t:CDS:10 [Cetraspora pellucida]|uniref:19426_t:CDS:1 n=1 Tax=Cetraspora pellucida TaxID=1433469 RepID=A0A9N9FPU1_9GLOM|nr:19426_t:CDS:10 [Cetraspora pellucida]
MPVLDPNISGPLSLIAKFSLLRITINEYHLNLIPFEDELLSLKLDNTFKDIYLDDDYTSIYYVARALMKLQTSFGLFPRKIGKGDCAKHLADMLIHMRREVAVDDPSSSLSISQSVDPLIIIDRSVDLITPLCTQLTYEGLYFVSKLHMWKWILRSWDLRKQLQVTKRINEDYEERHKAKTVVQIREFINKLGSLQLEHQSLKIHLVAGIDVNIQNEHIEEMINRQVPLTQFLRLLCLQSLVNGGLKQKIEEHNPQDIAYVYSGYAPLSVRLMQYATTKSGSSSTGNGWKGYEEMFRCCPGKTFDEVQRKEEGAYVPKSNFYRIRNAQDDSIIFSFSLFGGSRGTAFGFGQ